MSSVEYLREFVSERLTAAAEEIFVVFKQTVVKYEEEIDRQRRLLEIVWKPQIKLHRIELQQQHVCIKEEEVLADQQLCIQERNSSLDQEDPEPPQIKEEQEELCTSQEGEQLVLKQETDTFMLTPTYEESAADIELPATMCIGWRKNKFKVSQLSEVSGDHQLLSHISEVAESQDQKEGKHGDSGSTRNAQPKPRNIPHKKWSHGNNVYNPTMLKMLCHTHTGIKSLKCDTCGKAFKYKSKLQRHLSIHTGEKPYLCTTCGKRFSDTSVLNTHVRIHTGEKPYSCKTCGREFRCSSGLLVHTRTHTGEKPYSCKLCGKGFKWSSGLTLHMRTHSGERPYTCQKCGRDFRSTSNLKGHMRTHTGENLYHCSAEGSDVYSGQSQSSISWESVSQCAQ